MLPNYELKKANTWIISIFKFSARNYLEFSQLLYSSKSFYPTIQNFFNEEKDFLTRVNYAGNFVYS
jgi:hypothetical protein